MGQWVDEARSKLADRSIKICEYHGGSRPRDIKLLSRNDVVVTTYETLVSDFQGRSKKVKGEPNPLACIKWWRVVLDESHAVKGDTSKQLKAVLGIHVRPTALRPRWPAAPPPAMRGADHDDRAAVQSDRRWACSGTPINMDLKDLTGQFSALHMTPLDAKNFQSSVLRNGLGSTASSVMFLLRTLMIRHSKAAVEASGAMKLPPKTEELVAVEYNTEEWTTYAETFRSVRDEFNSFARLGPSYCLTHSLMIMSLLMPLRRLCSGGTFPTAGPRADLRAKKHQEAVAALDAAPACTSCPQQSNEPIFPAADDTECPICMDVYEDPRVTPCGHWFCAECILQVLQQRASCPISRLPLTPAQLRRAVYPPEPEEEGAVKAEATEAAKEEDADAPGPSKRRRTDMVQFDSKTKVRAHAAP